MTDAVTPHEAGTEVASTDDPAGYAAALNELETILSELEGDDVDVDVLAARVARASDLIRFCRQRILSARAEVERVVADLDGTPIEAGS